MANKNNIIKAEQNGVEFFTVEESGESGMSVSGLARFCGVEQARITELLQKVLIGKDLPESLEPMRGKEFELSVGSSYRNARIIADWACGCIIEYYALDAKKPTPEAKKAMRMFRDESIRRFMQTVTGWQPRSESKLHLAPYWYQRQVQFLADNKVPAGYFSIFGETITLVAELETAGYTLPDSAIPDISIGKCWANHLRKERINPDSISVMYPHKYPNYAYAVDAKAYLEEYLPKFRKWFRDTYKPTKMPAYFKGKDSAALPAISRLLGLPAGVSI